MCLMYYICSISMRVQNGKARHGLFDANSHTNAWKFEVVMIVISCRLQFSCGDFFADEISNRVIGCVVRSRDIN